jgi:methyl-accepting chemotaxis protein
LNDSIIEMLQISSEISDARDLTLKLPVKEDITGPLGDALNRVTSESARVLVQVREIAERVGQASAEVQAQGRQVVAVADAERTQIEQTANDLAHTVEAIDQIGELAQYCSDAANKATQSNDEALASVKGAVQGMGNIRASIQETGKRIKRLGERSQEISGIVDIINSFSERTHVLAINASMQAATAGEAGRGFAVVAQEVQRLADSSRQATNQIATLIRNIQVETQDTIQTVNQATEAVGSESRTIEGAGDRMLATQQTTANLAEAVRQIDASAQAQVAANRTLMTRVDTMRASTVETTDQIDQQAKETNSLVGYSRQLLDSIGLFRLPAATPTSEPGRT